MNIYKYFIFKIFADAIFPSSDSETEIEGVVDLENKIVTLSIKDESSTANDSISTAAITKLSLDIKEEKFSLNQRKEEYVPKNILPGDKNVNKKKEPPEATDSSSKLETPSKTAFSPISG